MLKTYDGVSYKRVAGKAGDRTPALGLERERALYTATGGEISITVSALTGGFLYYPGHSQIEVKRSSGGALIAGVDFFETSPTTISFPASDCLQVGEIVEITKNLSVTGIMALASRADVFTGTAFPGQTLIAADFSWDLNLNPGKGTGAVKVFINGLLRMRGTHYTEVDQGLARTNQIRMASALAANDAIQILPIYQAIDDSAAATSHSSQISLRTQEALTAMARNFIDESALTAAPGTTIYGRAKVTDPEKNLKAYFGVERIAISDAIELQKEIGASNERVYSAGGDRASLIRLTGRWNRVNDTSGVGVVSWNNEDSANEDSAIEVTFFGTGLNLLMSPRAGNSQFEFRVSVDGGSESALTIPGMHALDARNYSSNVAITAARGLPQGLHTVKVRREYSATSDLIVFGVEILNESNSISVSPGSAFIAGRKVNVASRQSIAYDAAATGNSGGRALVYLTSDGTLGQSFQAVASTSRFMAATDHTSEEISRVYYWREFGAGRSDDFSKLGNGSLHSYTLEDGTTTLSVAPAYFSDNTLYAASSTGEIVFTFIGTGLDITVGSFPTGAFMVSVDGEISSSGSNYGAYKTYKICSGLPYGTHTVRIANQSGDEFNVEKFIVYAPKKPSIPSDAIEICDYFVLGSVLANSAVNIDKSARGAISKMPTREAIYVNGTGHTWTVNAPSTIRSSRAGVPTVSTYGQNAYVEFSIFGTGFDFRTVTGSSQSDSMSVQITNSSGAFVSLNSSYPGAPNIGFGGYGGVTYGGISAYSSLSSAGPSPRLSCRSTAGAGSGFYVRDLPLGAYRVRITQTATASASLTNLTSAGIDVFSPVHSPKSRYNDVQNTLPVGSCSIGDSRVLTPFEGANQRNKVWAQAINGNRSTASTSSDGYVPIPEMSVSLTAPAASLKVSYSVTASNSTSTANFFVIYVNGVAMGRTKSFSGTSTATVSDSLIIPVNEGFHKIEVYYAGLSGVLNATSCTLTVEEI